MTQVTTLLQQANLVEPATIQELARWGAPVEATDAPSLPTLDKLPTLLAEAIEVAQSEELSIRQTDMDALRQYRRTACPAFLTVHPLSGEQSTFDVSVGRRDDGVILLPWNSDPVAEVFADCELTLRIQGDPQAYRLSPYGEVFYGEAKALSMWVATPLPEKGVTDGQE